MIVRLKPFRQISPLKLETSLSCQRIHDSVLSFSVHHLRSCTQGTKSSVKLNHTWLVSHIGSHFAHDRINHLILFSLAPCYTQSSCTVIQICTYRRQVFVLSGHADQGSYDSHSLLVSFTWWSISITRIFWHYCSQHAVLGLAWAVLLPRLGAVSAVSIGFNIQQLEMRRTFGPERHQVTWRSLTPINHTLKFSRTSSSIITLEIPLGISLGLTLFPASHRSRIKLVCIASIKASHRASLGSRDTALLVMLILGFSNRETLSVSCPSAA